MFRRVLELTLYVFLISPCIGTNETNAIRLGLAATKPQTAVELGGDLVGFSFEADRFPEWAGPSRRKNNFTYNLLQNLKDRTGKAPPVRVGGGSQDHIISTPNVTGDPGYYNVFEPVPRPHNNTKALFPQAHFTGAGAGYWLPSCHLPADTRFSWGVNMLAGNASEAVAQVKQLERVFADPLCKDVDLHTIEIGNEADLFGDGVRRPENWTVRDYTRQQVKYVKDITQTLGENGRKYRIGDWAGRMNVVELLNTGIMESVMGSSINVISEHRYQGPANMSGPGDWPGMAAGLVSKASIRGRLDKFNVSVAKSQEAGVEFVLGETGSFSGHGQSGVSNAAASAIWMVDYGLQAATRGISELHFHQGVGYNYSAFVPVDHVGVDIETWDGEARRRVMPQYYGYLMVADAIGWSGEASISEVHVENPFLSAYQIWEGSKLARLVLINSDPWTGQTGDRPSVSLDLQNVALGVGGGGYLTYKVFETESLLSTGGLLWGGQSWETDDGRAAGRETFRKLMKGSSLRLSASSVAIVYLQV